MPGYDFGEPVFEAFLEMRNVVGVKWSSNDQKFALSMYRRYADQLNFIDNDMPAALSLPGEAGRDGLRELRHARRAALRAARLGAVPRPPLRRARRAPAATYVDPFLGLAEPEDVVWASMGEGPHARAGMEALGLRMGPAFPAQQPLSGDSLRRIQRRLSDAPASSTGSTGARSSGPGARRWRPPRR